MLSLCKLFKDDWKFNLTQDEPYAITPDGNKLYYSLEMAMYFVFLMVFEKAMIPIIVHALQLTSHMAP